MSMSKFETDRWAELGLRRREAHRDELEKLRVSLQKAQKCSVFKLDTEDRIQLLKLTVALGAYNDRIGQDSPFHTLSEDILLMIVNNILPRKYIEEDGVTKAGIILGLNDFWQFTYDNYSPRIMDILTCHEKIVSFIEKTKVHILETRNSRCPEAYQNKEVDTKIQVELRQILQELGVPLRDYDFYNHSKIGLLEVYFVEIERPYILERDIDPYFDVNVLPYVTYVDQIQFYTA